MKKKIKMMLTLWLGMSCNVIFSNVYATNNLVTISEYLQDNIESNNNLVTANEKLVVANENLAAKCAKENLELRKENKELQNKMSELEKILKERTEWVEVPLADTQSFDVNCEYSAQMLVQVDNNILNKQGTFYAASVENSYLHFFLGYNGNDNRYAAHAVVVYNKKGSHVCFPGGAERGPVTKLEKRCLR